MIELIDFVIVFVSTLASLLVLGLVAGFSPALYSAQIALSVKAPTAATRTIALMTGVLTAIILLLALFQATHLDTALGYIHTPVQALTVSIVVNILIGIALICGGLHYLRHREVPQAENDRAKLKKTSTFVGLAGHGFMRTLLGIGGVAAIYIAGNLIADVGTGLAEQVVYTVLFLGVTIIPFVIIIVLVRKNPSRLAAMTNASQTLLERINYRLIVGTGAIIFGFSVIIFNSMIGLFY